MLLRTRFFPKPGLGSCGRHLFNVPSWNRLSAWSTRPATEEQACVAARICCNAQN
jgi:hypothetical protein